MSKGNADASPKSTPGIDLAERETELTKNSTDNTDLDTSNDNNDKQIDFEPEKEQQKIPETLLPASAADTDSM